MHVALWIGQAILGVVLICAALAKLVQPIGDGINTSFITSDKPKTYTDCSCWNFCTYDLRQCFSYRERRGFTDWSKFSFCADCRFYSVGKIQKSTNISATNEYNLPYTTPGNIDGDFFYHRNWPALHQVAVSKLLCCSFGSCCACYLLDEIGDSP